jgi:hypothetical protein
MKFKPKIIIAISTFCVLTGVLLVFLYSLTDPDTRFRERKTELYNKEYKATLDSCKKWGGTISRKIDVNRLANKDSNFIYLAILIEKYKTLDLGYFRGGTFCDICGDSIRTLIHAQDDAEYDYLKTKYGKEYRKFVRTEAHEMNEKYNIIYYDTILSGLSQKAYKKRITKENIEVGEFNKTFLNSIPFVVRVDTTSYHSNKDLFTFVETKDKIIFKATHKSYEDPKKYLLPKVSIYFYFDSEKTDFPYSAYSFKNILLTGE